MASCYADCQRFIPHLFEGGYRSLWQFIWQEGVVAVGGLLPLLEAEDLRVDFPSLANPLCAPWFRSDKPSPSVYPSSQSLLFSLYPLVSSDVHET